MRFRRQLCLASVALAATGLAGAGSVWTASRALSAVTTTSAPQSPRPVALSPAARPHPLVRTAPHRTAPRRVAGALAKLTAAQPLEKRVTVATTPAASTLPDSTSAGAATAPQPGLATLGRITIAAIGLDQPLYEGIEQRYIDAGPTHWPGTALPGAPGNMVLTGHRTTHTEPFHLLANMHAGDADRGCV